MTDWRAIAAGTGTHYLLGALWYAPFTFGGPWARAIGAGKPEGRPRPSAYVGTFVGSLLASAATTALARAAAADSPASGARLGLLVGAGYGVGLSATYAVSPTVPRPAVLTAITGAYQVVGHVLAGAAIGAVRSRSA